MTARDFALALLAALWATGLAPGAAFTEETAATPEEEGAAAPGQPAEPEDRTEVNATLREVGERAKTGTLEEQKQSPYVWRGQLMTPEERKAHYEKVRSFETRDEVRAYRAKNRRKLEARARERGLIIVDGRPPGREILPIRSMGGVQGTAERKKNDRKAVTPRSLMTDEERAEYRKKVRSFETQEEREAYRDEHHAKLLERAKEQGVAIRETPGAPGGVSVGVELQQR